MSENTFQTRAMACASFIAFISHLTYFTESETLPGACAGKRALSCQTALEHCSGYRWNDCC